MIRLNDPLYSNFFVTRDSPFKEIPARYYSLADEVPPALLPSVMKKLQWALYSKAIYAGSRKDRAYFLHAPNGLPEEIYVEKFRFLLSEEVVTLRAARDGAILETIVSWAFKRRIWQLHFTGPDGTTYYECVPYKQEYFNFHRGFSFDVEVLPDGRIGVWIDPKIRWKQPVSTYVKWLQAHGYSPKEIITHLGGRKVRCPTPAKNTDFIARIHTVANQSLGEYPYAHEGKVMSLYDYWLSCRPTHALWLKRKEITLNPSDNPVVVVDVPSLNINEKPYPAAVAELLIDLSNPEIPEFALRQKVKGGQAERIQKTLEIYDRLHLGTPLNLGETKVTFTRELFNWAAAPVEGIEVENITPPDIAFGGGFVLPGHAGRDPNFAQALSDHGPVTTKETVPLTLIVPQQWEDLIAPFHEQLQGAARYLRLGTYTLEDIILLDTLSPDDYLRQCRSIGPKIGKNVAVVALGATGEKKTYSSAKRGLGDHFVRSQMVRGNTFTRVARWDGKAEQYAMNSLLRNFAVQIYDKYLETGETIWHLARPAGGLDPSKNVFFMGFDVSRTPSERKEAAAYCAVCDAYGRVVTRKVITAHKGEKVPAKELSDWFFDAACAAFDASGHKVVDCIILFKDGPIRPNQVIEYETGALEARDRLIQQGIMNTNSDIKVVSVVKQSARRLYADLTGKKKIFSTVLYRDSRHAMGVTSITRLGTPAVLRLGLEFQIVEDMTIKDIYHIFNDLRYLDYDSLFSQPKTILPLHVVQHLAKLSKEDIIVPYVPRS